MVFFVALTTVLFSQNEKLLNHQLFLGFDGGLNYNFNGYRVPADDNGFSFQQVNPHFQIGMNLSYLALPRLRPRLELAYVKNSYDMDWGNFNDDFATTKTSLNYINMNLFADFLLVNRANLQLFLFTGIKNEILLSDRYVRTDKNGDTEAVRYNFIDDEYPGAISGGAIGSIVRYQVNDQIGITLKPEYTVFFRNFVRANQATYQRLGFSVGVEIGF
jgi:hypothetical protein